MILLAKSLNSDCFMYFCNILKFMFFGWYQIYMIILYLLLPFILFSINLLIFHSLL
jgi:hypothetical protein